MYDGAIEQFGIASAEPPLAGAYFNLGNAWMQKGAAEAALPFFETAIPAQPGKPAFEANLRGAGKS